MGLRAITLARRLRLHSALPAPSCLPWDRDLSEKAAPILPAIIKYRAAHPEWRGPEGLLRAVDSLVRLPPPQAAALDGPRLMRPAPAPPAPPRAAARRPARERRADGGPPPHILSDGPVFWRRDRC